MKKRLWFVLAVLILFALPAVFIATAQEKNAGNDNTPGPAEVVIPNRYRAETPVADTAAIVYFTPMDEVANTTVLFFYNTGNVDQTIRIETFDLEGTPEIDTSLNVPAGQLVRVAADTVDATGAATWEDTVLVNFRTFSTYGRLTLPEGVKATGYVAWNGDATYRPNDPVPVLDLRFSSDPNDVFLPLQLK